MASSHHCAAGQALFAVYRGRALKLAAIDRQKQTAIRLVSRNEWLDIARRVDHARLELGRTRTAYIEHVIGCDSCDWSRNIAEYLRFVDDSNFEALADSA